MSGVTHTPKIKEIKFRKDHEAFYCGICGRSRSWDRDFFLEAYFVGDKDPVFFYKFACSHCNCITETSCKYGNPESMKKWLRNEFRLYNYDK